MIKYFIIRRPFIMAREKKPVHRVQMTEGKRNIILSIFIDISKSFCYNLRNWIFLTYRVLIF